MASTNLGRVMGDVIIVKSTTPTTRDDGSKLLAGDLSKLLAGDLWINSSTYNIYKYNGTSFADTGMNIKGEKGDKGDTGAAGAEGKGIEEDNAYIFHGEQINYDLSEIKSAKIRVSDFADVGHDILKVYADKNTRIEELDLADSDYNVLIEVDTVSSSNKLIRITRPPRQGVSSYETSYHIALNEISFLYEGVESSDDVKLEIILIK